MTKEMLLQRVKDIAQAKDIKELELDELGGEKIVDLITGKTKGMKVNVVIGGPTIYIDTKLCRVIGNWGNDEATAPLKHERVAMQIENYYGENRPVEELAPIDPRDLGYFLKDYLQLHPVDFEDYVYDKLGTEFLDYMIYGSNEKTFEDFVFDNIIDNEDSFKAWLNNGAYSSDILTAQSDAVNQAVNDWKERRD